MRGKLVLPAESTTVEVFGLKRKRSISSEAAVKEADIVILGVPSDAWHL